MLYTAAGAVLASVVAIAAWRRSLRRGGYYDHMEYGMESRTHLRYCAISLAFAAFFAVALALQWTIAGMVALAAFVAIAVFYGASFLRGASHDER
jgi:hypothetical protein